MHKKIVSTCSPNNNMYLVCIQYIVKKFPDGLFLVTPYVSIRDKQFLIKTMEYEYKVQNFIFSTVSFYS